MKKNLKANDLEMQINFKAIKIAHIATVVLLTVYCIYDFIVRRELSIVTAIWILSLVTFFMAKLVYTKKMIEGDDDNSTR